MIETDPVTGGPAPYDPDGGPLSPEADMRARWLPTPESLAHAKALLDADPWADVAFIPMIQPGKVYDIWTLGQEVRTVPGVVFLAARDDEARGSVLGYSHARRLCDLIAGDVLVQAWKQRRDASGELCRPGTTGYAVASRYDGKIITAVFEGI